MTLPRDVTRFRQLLATTFNTTATIQRVSRVADNTGGTSDSYATVMTLPCQFYRQGTTPRERETTTQVQVTAIWIFVFPYGTELLNTDRITCNGRQFEVTSAATGSFELAARVLAVELV